MTTLKGCKDFCERLSEYLDGEVGEHECRLIEAHLEECPPCALVYKSLCTSVEVCNKGVSCEIPDDVRQRLLQFLREHCDPGYSAKT